MNGLSPIRYVEWALADLTAATPSDDEVWERLLPWSVDVKAACAKRPGEKVADVADALVEVDPEALNPD